ncbi:MAG: hypothetical protein SNI42_05780, partial [Rikenellaceae bacterium]
MNRIGKYLLVIVGTIAAVTATGCAALYATSGYDNDSMYSTHSRTTSYPSSTTSERYTTTTESIDMELYNTPYGQKLLALSAASSNGAQEVVEYTRPDSYYIYVDSYAMRPIYNPFFYSHWHRPFHHWGRPYHHHWNLGWNSWNYSWNWGWNYGWGWNSSWYGSWYGGFRYPMIYMPYRPIYRPNYRPSYSKPTSKTKS